MCRYCDMSDGSMWCTACGDICGNPEDQTCGGYDDEITDDAFRDIIYDADYFDDMEEAFA